MIYGTILKGNKYALLNNGKAVDKEDQFKMLMKEVFGDSKPNIEGDITREMAEIKKISRKK